MEIDHTRGIQQLRNLLPENSPQIHLKFLALETRLQENLYDRKYGPDEHNRSQLLRIIASLNKFIDEDLRLDISFIDLCKFNDETVSVPVVSPSSPPQQKAVLWQEGEMLSIQGQDYGIDSLVQQRWFSGDSAFVQQAAGRHGRSGQKVWIKGCQIFHGHEAVFRLKRDLEKEGRLLEKLQRAGQRDFPRFLGSESHAQSITLVYEKLAGRPLSAAFDPLPKPLDSQATRRLLSARHSLIKMLHALHTIPCSHRLLTPETLLLQPGTNRIILADLGLAAYTVQLGEGPQFYQSPEQLKGLPIPDRATDIYQLGAIFYDLLTGRHITDMSASQESGLSAELDALLRKAATPAVQDRWPNVYAFSNALRQLGY